ncbi:MAG: methyltransferase domain-containing protein [Solirubrobacteraceae bacterium]|jgi:SAM-dependent methyltransferase
MKPTFAETLRCPACLKEHGLRLHTMRVDEREVREGVLDCTACGATFPIHRGVPELLTQPPEHVLAEAAGLARFAEVMRDAGWDRDHIRRLPFVEDGYWYPQARSIHQLLTTIPFRAGDTILDVGSNTCWAASHFARRGLRAIALDIATAELQGLYTADYFIEDGSVFFERILGSMHEIPLASSSVDYVFCSQVMHHNDGGSLRRAFAEIFRVLRPGGRLLMVNETLKTVRDRRGVDTQTVLHTHKAEEFDGYEHAHWAWQYRWAATRAGFYTEVAEPHYRPFFGDAEIGHPPGASWLSVRLREAAFGLHRFALARRGYLVWLNDVWGGVSMNMIATKPSRYVVRHERLPAAVRIPLMVAAGSRLRWERHRGQDVPPRLSRTPEQAHARMRGAAEPAGDNPD